MDPMKGYGMWKAKDCFSRTWRIVCFAIVAGSDAL
jgi:hypothetical protein